VFILSALLHAIIESLNLPDEQQQELVDAFISTIPPLLANRLVYSP
jgi:hypothetical protein